MRRNGQISNHTAMIESLRRHIMVQQGGGVLPSEYQQVEYIGSTGVQYLNFGILAGVYGCIVDFSITEIPSSNKVIYGGYGWQNAHLFYTPQLDINVSKDESIGAISESVVYRAQLFERVLIDAYYTDARQVKVNGSPAYVRNNIAQIPQFIMCLFNWPSLSGFKSNINIYSFLIKDTNGVDKILYPCYRKSDNKPGMYDIVNSVFYTNVGTGEFIVGPNV